jgi:hypothetical protein
MARSWTALSETALFYPRRSRRGKRSPSISAAYAAVSCPQAQDDERP